MNSEGVLFLVIGGAIVLAAVSWIVFDKVKDEKQVKQEVPTYKEEE